ncbi:hypothetical protein PS838_00237 [Pseudomonas fluorescens]|nr:hypothetical protein PS838_00237 [Pseudomonas fluorescens]
MSVSGLQTSTSWERNSTMLLMQPKLFYRARQAAHDVFIDGHFYNDHFYHHQHEFIGQIEADGAFRYYEEQENGQPTSPEHIAGHVVGLVLILSDDTLFNLVEVDRQSLEKS